MMYVKKRRLVQTRGAQDMIHVIGDVWWGNHWWKGKGISATNGVQVTNAMMVFYWGEFITNLP